MIIDVHTHVWSSLDQLGPDVAERLRLVGFERWGHLDATPGALERAMGCVDAALLLGFRSDRLGARVPNEYIAQVSGSAPARLIGIAGIDPMHDDHLDELETAIGLGLLGITVSPAAQGFHPTRSSAMRIYERCVELAMPVFAINPEPQPASAELEFARPAHWDEVVRSFPELRLIIGGMGHPWVEETCVLVGKHRHVYADISGVASRPWQLYNALLHASSVGVMDRLLFGSGFPYDTPAKTIESLYSVNGMVSGTPLPTVPRTSIRSIVERDSLAVLGIDAVVAPRPDRVGEDEPDIPVARSGSPGEDRG